MADYVLTNFDKEELASLPQLIDGAVDALEMIIAEGVAKTMNLYNNKCLV
jgi:PTH1 family peptidyl-tRNA hydrolase